MAHTSCIITPLPCVVNMGYEKTDLVHVRHIYSELKQPTLKHLPQIILTTALIEAWHGELCITNVSHGLTPHLILDLALPPLICAGTGRR
jgi:hypothetical protein